MATPEGWREHPLADLTIGVQAGTSVNSEGRTAGVGELGVLMTSAVTYGRFDATAHKAVVPEEVGRVRTPVRGGTVLFSRMNTPSLVGASAYVGEDHPNLYLPDRLWELQASSSTDARWLALVLGTEQTRRRIAGLATGTSASMKNIAKAKLLGLDLLVPPLPEQRKIAAILSSVDETIEKTEAVIAQLQLVKKAMMQELLTRGMPGRHTRFKQTDIGEIPEEWDVVKLGHLILRGPDNGIYRHASEYGDGTPIVRIDAFDAGDELRTGNLRRVRLNDESVSRYGLKPGDIVINRVNSLTHIGKAALVTELVEATVFESNMMRLSVDATLVTPRFAHLWISGEFARQFFRSNAKQAVAQASINQDDVRSLPFPVPPVSEQEAIVDTLAAVTSMMASENRSLGASLGLKRSLSAALLSGDLRVAPDPSEQPAQPA